LLVNLHGQGTPAPLANGDPFDSTVSHCLVHSLLGAASGQWSLGPPPRAFTPTCFYMSYRGLCTRTFKGWSPGLDPKRVRSLAPAPSLTPPLPRPLAPLPRPSRRSPRLSGYALLARAPSSLAHRPRSHTPSSLALLAKGAWNMSLYDVAGDVEPVVIEGAGRSKCTARSRTVLPCIPTPRAASITLTLSISRCALSLILASYAGSCLAQQRGFASHAWSKSVCVVSCAWS
jgi:hypothetical protein